MKTDLLTIVMPVHMRKDYFLGAIESALNQTVKCEIIVVDDGSNHTFFEDTCREHNIQYIRNEKNLGMYGNLTKCIKLPKTPYVYLLHDDDSIHPTFIEEFLAAQKEHPGIDIYFTNFDLYYFAEKEYVPHEHTLPWGYQPDGSKVIEYGIKYGIGMPMIAIIYRQAIFTEYYTAAHGANDWLWVYENVDKLQVYGNEHKLVNYGAHSGQDTGNPITHVKVVLATAYIYAMMAEKVTDKPALYKRVKEREHNAFLYFLSNTPNSFFEQLNGESHIYAEYYKKMVASKKLYQVLSTAPHKLKWFLYRGLLKLKLIERGF
jgi:glycosyltransferase involved in cell wall biosynthesis